MTRMQHDVGFRAFLVMAALCAGLLLPTGCRAQGTKGGSDSARTTVTQEEDNPLSPAPPAPRGMEMKSSVGNGARVNDMSAPAFRSAPMGGAGLGAPTLGYSTLGASVGGAKDIGYARKLIADGMIPKFIDFSPEGLYSEHDIPTPAGRCDERLCLSLGYGYAPTADNSSYALFVHLGMSSNIRPEEFKRQPLQLALVVDRSGSMMDGNMDAVKRALRALVDKLGPEDEIMLVDFNEEAQLLLAPRRVGDRSSNDRAAIRAAIDSIVADGGTSIEAGLTMGFEGIAALPERPGVARRVMLFTDAVPNIGNTDTAGFRELTARYASRGIGLTAFGVGVDFGQELIYHISQLRGGNFFYLESPEKIARVFDTEFDYLVTPLAYDLNVRVATPQGLKLTAVYGLPTWKPGSRDAELHIPTVFLSSNRGAIILRYERDDAGAPTLATGDAIAEGSLSFTDPDGTPHAERTTLRHDGRARLEPGTQFYTHDGMRMAVALTNVYFGLRDACTLLSEGKRDEALAVLGRARGIATLENMTLLDTGLAGEVKLLQNLEENIDKGGRIRAGATDRDVKR